jgi:hypothetical protein
VNNEITFLVRELLESIAEFAALIGFHGAENVNFLKEFIVMRPLAACRILNNVIESITVQFEKLALLVGRNRSLTRSVIKKGELTERLAWLVGLQERWLLFVREDLSARQSATAHNIKTVALIVLLNNFGSGGNNQFFHRTDYDCLFLFVEGGEHECLAHLVDDSRFRLLVLGHYLWLKVFLFVKTAERFRRDRYTGAARLGLLHHLRKNIAVVVFLLNDSMKSQLTSSSVSCSLPAYSWISAIGLCEATTFCSNYYTSAVRLSSYWG